MATRRSLLAFTLACAAMARPSFAAPPDPNAILLDLKRFATTGRVLMVAAHPDDENTQLITYLARGRAYRMAYLSVTRGDGGQNVLGPEFGDELGLIRTQELLAARRLDGGEQFFTRARDFGFSKSPDETLKIWDKKAVLGDVVRVIRTFQPDVIVTRFSPLPSNTHGHHTSSAILALEAFKLAADPTAYPEQLTTLKPWQAKRILQNSGFGGNGNASVQIDVSGEDLVLHQTYAEIAGRSRAMHKSQGFGNFAGGRGGARQESFTLLAGDPATTDIMDGVDTTWKRIPGADDVDAKVAAAISAFDPANPSASVPALIAIQKAIANVPEDRISLQKRALLNDILRDCLGLTVTTTLADPLVVPGEKVTLKHTITVSGPTPVRLVRILAPSSPEGVQESSNIDLPPNQPLSRETVVTIRPDRPVSQPYWLAKPAATGIYTVADPDMIGHPENDPAIRTAFGFEVAGGIVAVMTDATGTASHRRAEIIAPVSLAFPFDVSLFKPGTPRTVHLEVTAHRPDAKGTAWLNLPDGWKATPRQQNFALASAGEKATVSFEITPPPNTATAEITAGATVGYQLCTTGWQEINYPHIPPLLLQPQTTLLAVSAPIAISGHEIGYYPGAGDSVAECLTEMGYHVTPLTPDDLDPAKLKKYDAVVIGVRAFNVRPELKDKSQALFDYAERGGTVVEQYNRPDRLDNVNLAPYPLRLSGQRVTDETAEMTLLAPEHRALNFPNKITQDDFKDWVQERGIYYPMSWDNHWVPLLSAHDPNEQPLDGGLLVAQHGQGYFVYTGLVFFRQLPAGNPGAYRLFANLVSLGKH